MSGRRRTVLISVAVLVAVLPSCGSADPQEASSATLADATTSASQSTTGGQPDPTGSDVGSGDQTGGQGGRTTGSGTTGGPAAPPSGPGPGTTAPPAGPAPGTTAPPAGPGAGSEPPPAGPATSAAPPADPGPARPGGEPAGGSGSPARVGGAPPDADIIDRLSAFFSFDDFKAAQLAECGVDYPDCVRVEIDPEQSAAGADGSWCAWDITPPPAADGLNAFVQSKPPGEAVIVVSVVLPGVDEQGEPLCDGSQGPPT